MQTETIDHGGLSRLVEADEVKGVHIVAQTGGWAVFVRDGVMERPLTAQRSRQVRLFRKMETLVSYLSEMGIARFDVDAANYHPDSLKNTRRPDRSVAMKKTHEAAAYDTWLRDKVQASIDDPRPSISSADVKAHFTQRRQAMKTRMIEGKS